MITTKDTTSRTRAVWVRAAHHIRVSEILAFADQLRAENVPHDTMVDPEKADNGHLIALRVRVHESHDTIPGDDAATTERTRLVGRLRREARDSSWGRMLDGSYVIERMADLLAADTGDQADGEAGDE